MKYNQSFAVLAVLFSTADAVALKHHHKYRPYTDGSTPWYKTHARQPAVGFAHGYSVPSYGDDPDIAGTQNNIKNTEATLKHELNASFKAPPLPYKVYTVPNFGRDSDINTTQQHLDAAQHTTGHEWKNASFAAPAEPKRGYFVPQFGVDSDIVETQKHIKASEGTQKHELAASFAPAPKPYKEYSVPNFGQDADVVGTLSNVANAETALKHKLVQVGTNAFVEAQSDPVCSSAGCTQYKHKKTKLGYALDYPVVNNGVDEDIKDSQASVIQAEKDLTHDWEFGTKASKAHWKNPAKATNYNFSPKLEGDMIATAKNLADTQTKLGHKWVIEDVQLDQKPNLVQSETDVNAESDPICSSAGCTQYKHKKTKLGYPLNYGVPNNGVDTDIKDSEASVVQAQKDLSHDWEFGTKASAAKWKNPAKATNYDFSPKLEGDMIATSKNLADTQTRLGHKWVIEDLQIGADVESDPICNSSGCTQYKHKKTARGWDINYGVPNFGADADIMDSDASLNQAQKDLSHNWEFGTKASAAKWKNPAKLAPYNFAPKLSEEMITTDKNLADTQIKLMHKWVIEDNDGYKPNY